MGLFKDCGCGCNGKKQEKKLWISLMSALVFFIVANPDTFRIMRTILGSWVSGPNGCPTTAGLILHTIVFMLVTWGMMNIKVESYAPTEIMSQEPAKPMAQSDVADPVKMPVGPSPRMVDMPSPFPGMTEPTYELTDSGNMYEPMDINSDMDLPKPYTPTKSKKGDVTTCSCSDGSNVTITA
jgi:hypothetical protein